MSNIKAMHNYWSVNISEIPLMHHIMSQMFCCCLQDFRYKTISPISFVDETLFGSPKRIPRDPEWSVVLSQVEYQIIWNTAHLSKEEQLNIQRRKLDITKVLTSDSVCSNTNNGLHFYGAYHTQSDVQL